MGKDLYYKNQQRKSLICAIRVTTWVREKVAQFLVKINILLIHWRKVVHKFALLLQTYNKKLPKVNNHPMGEPNGRAKIRPIWSPCLCLCVGVDPHFGEHKKREKNIIIKLLARFERLRDLSFFKKKTCLHWKNGQTIACEHFFECKSATHCHLD
jgi:hypothetical protein